MNGFFKNNIEFFKKFIFGVALIAVFKTFDYLASIFHSLGTVINAAMPFVAAFIVAYMLNLPSVKLESVLKKTDIVFIKKHSRGISILLIYIFAIMLVAITVGALVPAIYENLLEMTRSLPMYLSDMVARLGNIQAIKDFNIDFSDISIDATMNSLLETFDINLIGSYVGRVFNMTSGLASVIIALIASVYMLFDKDNILKSLERFINLIFKKKMAGNIVNQSRRINEIFTKFIYCRLICGIICGTICVIVLSLLGVRYAIILGIFIGAMDLIPYFGSIISCVIAILITFITGGAWQGLWVAIALLVIQQFDGHILAPKLMGDTLEIRPLWIVIAVAVGGKLFGFMGMLLAVPIIAVVRTIVSDYLQSIEAKRHIHDEAQDQEDLK